MSTIDSSGNYQDSGAKNSVAKVGWYILDQNQQNVGPYTISELHEHVLNGFLSESTLALSKGRSKWQPPSSIPEFISGIPRQDNNCFATEGNALLNSVKEVDDSRGVSPNDHDGSDEFEKWQRKIREAEAERLKNKSVSRSVSDEFGIDDLYRPVTPPEGEEEFTDDDGTRYKWEGKVISRKYKEWILNRGNVMVKLRESGHSLTRQMTWEERMEKEFEKVHLQYEKRQEEHLQRISMLKWKLRQNNLMMENLTQQLHQHDLDVIETCKNQDMFQDKMERNDESMKEIMKEWRLAEDAAQMAMNDAKRAQKHELMAWDAAHQSIEVNLMLLDEVYVLRRVVDDLNETIVALITGKDKEV